MFVFAAVSCLVAVGAIAALFVITMKAGRVKEKLNRMVVALDPTKKGASSRNIDDIITEIDGIRLQKLRLEAIVEATPFPMLLADAKGLIISANQAGLE